MKYLGIIILRLFGWSVELASSSWSDQCVIIVAPHTSNWDYFYAFFLRWIVPVKVHYIGKKELFTSPMGWFFRFTGGSPIERGQNKNQVESIIDLFKNKKEFRLALSPEGTRQLSSWKSGFYHIALGAGVPLYKVRIDYKQKRLTIDGPQKLTGNKEIDFAKIQAFYQKAEPKYPKSFENLSL